MLRLGIEGDDWFAALRHRHAERRLDRFLALGFLLGLLTTFDEAAHHYGGNSAEQHGNGEDLQKPADLGY